MCEAHCDINNSEQICLFEFSRSIWGSKKLTGPEISSWGPRCENMSAESHNLEPPGWNWTTWSDTRIPLQVSFSVELNVTQGGLTLLNEKPERCACLSEMCFWRCFYSASNKLNKRLERGQEEQQEMGISLILHRRPNKACYGRILV